MRGLVFLLLVATVSLIDSAASADWKCLAVPKDGGGIGEGYARTRAAATQMALEECSESNTGCRINYCQNCQGECGNN